MLSKHLKVSRKTLAVVLSIVLICSIISSVATYEIAKAQSSSNLPAQTLSAGPYPGAPSYTIFTDGQGNYYAKNSAGSISFTSTNAATLINDVTQLAANEAIYITAGAYPLSTQIGITYSNITLEGDGAATDLLMSTGAVTNGISVIQAYSVSGVMVENLLVDGNFAQQNLTGAVTQTNEYCILFNAASNCTVENVWVQHSLVDNIACVASTNILITDIHSSGAKYDDVVVDGSCSFITVTNVLGTSATGIEVHGNNCLISDCSISGSTNWAYGIEASGTYNTISDCWAINCVLGLVVDTGTHNTTVINFNTVGISGLYGILMRSEGSITGGMLKGDLQGGQYGLTVESQNVIINGVYATYWADGIHVSSNYCLITGCYAYNNGAWGITEANTGANYNMIIGCYARSNAYQIGLFGVNSQCHSCFNGTTWIT